MTKRVTVKILQAQLDQAARERDRALEDLKNAADQIWGLIGVEEAIESAVSSLRDELEDHSHNVEVS